MENEEKRLSNYIDSLNEEKKPIEHGEKIDTLEMSELFETVRIVRRLKQPSLPEDEFKVTLADEINMQLLKEKNSKKLRNRWFYRAVSAVAVVALIIALNKVGPFSKTNMVYAMQQAFKGMKAYHGVIEVVETNAEGKATTQSRIEVWADKEGRYYVKGLEGSQKGMVTINNGQKKWQIQSKQKDVEVFTAFPDPYSFTFELGKEIEEVNNSVKTKVIGEDTVAGRIATIVEVTPQGGSPYKLWIDKETKMPLQKQSAMDYSLQYTESYTSITFSENVPKELLAYSVPNGFKEINTNAEQVVNGLEEAKAIVGFEPIILKNIPASFVQNNISVINNTRTVKLNYVSLDNQKKVAVLQKKASIELKIASIAAIGEINNIVAEVQSPIQTEEGVLQGGGAYEGITGMNSVRWQQDGFEYAVVGNTSLDELALFIKAFVSGDVNLSSLKNQTTTRPQVQVPVDINAEQGSQKSVDAGHSPWKLDPAFVSQVFVSLKLSPGGIKGDYPINYEEFKVVQNNGKEAVVEVSGNKTPIRKVYLKRLVRQDNTGIWTIVGYDPK